MRRYGNLLGVLLTGLAVLLAAVLMLRQAWDWTLPRLFGFGPFAFRHLLAILALAVLVAGLQRLARQRGAWRRLGGR